MLAVLSGRFDEAVKLALSGADLNERDATGRTALSLAIQMERRELALALLLIATAKFTRPLPGLLQPSQLQQLQVWLSTSGREKEAAMQVLLQQYTDNLTAVSAPSDNGSQPHDDVWSASRAASSVAAQVAAGLVEMLVWAGRHAVTRLIDALVSSFLAHSANALPPSALALARSAEGLSVLHALILAGQPDAVTSFIAVLPPAEAAALRRHCDARGREAAQLDPAAAPLSLRPAVIKALGCLTSLPPISAMMLPPPPRVPTRAPAEKSPPLAAAISPGVAACAAAEASTANCDSVMGDAATLLELAASRSPTGAPTGTFVVGSGPAVAVAKVKRGAARKVSRGGLASQSNSDAADERRGAGWEANACDGHKLSSVLPPGRQPGELAGWIPLAGEATQRAFCEQRQALHLTEATVQKLGSRDAAVQYLEQLRHNETVFAPQSQHIVSTVDDSAIEMSTHYKRLATWGGFRRHHTKAQRAAATRDSDLAVGELSNSSFESNADISEAKMREQQASDNYARAIGSVGPLLSLSRATGNAPAAVDEAAVREQLQLNAAETESLLARLHALEIQRHQLEEMLR